MGIEIMIADDHNLIREGIKQLLELDGNMKIVSEAANGIECLNKLEDFVPDVLLLDINMPEKNGLEVLYEIKQKEYDTKVIILTMYNEAKYLLKAVDLGVDGYILKDSKSDELKKAIKYVVLGEKYIQQSLIPVLNNCQINRDIDKDKINLLTKKEMEVLIQISNGMINKEIATNLNISERTVKNHVSNIFKKIDVSDRTQAAIFAIKNKIVSLY